MSSYGGGIAASLGAPLVMTIGFIVWEDHWKGSAFALNLYKCCTASIGFLILSLVVQKTKGDQGDDLFPSEIFTTSAVGFLLLSSTIGILIGDWTWLKALKLMGARRVILMDSLKPFLAAFFGWLILNEVLRPAAIGGITLTVAGILIVSLDQTTDDDESSSIVESKKEDAITVDIRSSSLMTGIGADIESTETDHSESDDHEEKHEVKAQFTTAEASPAVTGPAAALDEEEAVTENTHNKQTCRQRIRIGYAMSILNVVLDTYGALLIKEHGVKMTVWAINLIRFGFAGLVMLGLSLAFTIHAGLVASPEKSDVAWYTLPVYQMTRSSWLRVSAGVMLVTFLTPALSNYALFQIALGLALTLGSIGPLYQLPLSYFMQNQVPTVRSLLGAVLAVGGIVVLAFRGTIPDE